MSTEEQIKYIKELKRFTRDISSDNKKSREFLIKAGIHTKSGRLKKAYRNNSTPG